MKILAAVILALIGAFFIGINSVIFYKSVVKKEDAPEVTPLLGGVAGAAAVTLFSGEPTWLAVIPLFLDWGSIPKIVRWALDYATEIVHRND